MTAKDGGNGEHHVGCCFVGWQKINGEWKIVSSFNNFVMEPTEIQ